MTSLLISPDYEALADEILTAAFVDSAAREAADFASAVEIRVTSGAPPALDTTIHLNSDDRRLFYETEFVGVRVLTPAERASRGKWVTITIRASTYRAGSDIFFVATSSPLIVGEGVVRRDGTVRFVASFPLEALGPGAHRFRVVGIRDLGNVTVADDGTIKISNDTAAEIARFDNATTATVRISGKSSAGGRHELVRYIPLRTPTPWYWMLVPIFAALVLGWMRRTGRLPWRRSPHDERDRFDPRREGPRYATRLPIGVAIGALAGLVPALIGWTGMFFDLGFAGLLSMAVVPILVALIRPRKVSADPETWDQPYLLRA